MEVKKYTRLDTVEATPMTFGEFYKNYRAAYSEEAIDKSAEGYRLMRLREPDEWKTKEDFEEHFTETNDYIGSMKFERNELLDRINESESYLKDHADDYLLGNQICAMRLYFRCLEKRIKQLENTYTISDLPVHSVI